MKKVLITDKEKINYAVTLDARPELKKVIQAAAALTPEDQSKAVKFVNERRRKA